MTIQSVDFISRIKAEALAGDTGVALISISEPDVEPARLAEFPEILRLVFHDVDDRVPDQWVLFDEDHARAVIDFVHRLQQAPEAYQVLVHCRAGISRSAATALYVMEATGCAFPRRPFAGLANKLMLEVLSRLSGLPLRRPRALPKRERFQVEVSRDFPTGMAEVVVTNAVTGETVVLEAPMLEVPRLVEQGIQAVWGIANPPSAHHVTDWEHLTGA